MDRRVAPNFRYLCEIILENASRVLVEEFPDLASKIIFNVPDESIRKLGQSIAAASLPEISL